MDKVSTKIYTVTFISEELPWTLNPLQHHWWVGTTECSRASKENIYSIKDKLSVNQASETCYKEYVIPKQEKGLLLTVDIVLPMTNNWTINRVSYLHESHSCHGGHGSSSKPILLCRARRKIWTCTCFGGIANGDPVSIVSSVIVIYTFLPNGFESRSLCKSIYRD